MFLLKQLEEEWFLINIVILYTAEDIKKDIEKKYIKKTIDVLINEIRRGLYKFHLSFFLFF